MCASVDCQASRPHSHILVKSPQGCQGVVSWAPGPSPGSTRDSSVLASPEKQEETASGRESPKSTWNNAWWRALSDSQLLPQLTMALLLAGVWVTHCQIHLTRCDLVLQGSLCSPVRKTMVQCSHSLSSLFPGLVLLARRGLSGGRLWLLLPLWVQPLRSERPHPGECPRGVARQRALRPAETSRSPAWPATCSPLQAGGSRPVLVTKRGGGEVRKE